MTDEQERQQVDAEIIKKAWYKRWWAIALYAIVGLLIVSSLMNRGQSNSTSEAPDSSQPTETQATNNEHFTNNNFSEVLTNANAHKGATVKIAGKVFAEPKKEGNAWQFQIYVDPQKSQGNTIIIGRSDFEIKSDMFVEIQGTVDGEENYKSLMGVDMSAPLIIATSILKNSAIDVLAPSQNVVNVNQSQDQFGVVITLERIEFSEPETRFYVKVKNNTTQKARVYSFNMKVTQGSQQFGSESKYGADDYPQLETELLPGVESSGIVVFPKTDYGLKQLTFHVEGSSENYNLRFEPYDFNVQWQ